MDTETDERKNQPVLVTGIAGFIGFHFAKKLISKGYPIIGIDNLNDYYDINLKTNRLKQLGFSRDQIDTIVNPNPDTRSIQLTAPQRLVFYRVNLKEKDGHSISPTLPHFAVALLLQYAHLHSIHFV